MTNKEFIYEKCFLLQKHLTYEDYIKKNPSLKESTKNILEKCGMTRPISKNSYVIKNDFTILIFQPFEEEVFDNKDSTQLILNINKNPSNKLIIEVIKKLIEEEF